MDPDARTRDRLIQRSKPRRLRVLAVDDDEKILKVIQTLLRRSGHQVVTSADSEEALKMLERGRSFDVIVSDIMRPRMDGLEFRRRILAHPRLRRIPFLFYAGFSEPEMLVKCACHGIWASAFLSKPAYGRQIVGAVEETALLALDRRARLRPLQDLFPWMATYLHAPRLLLEDAALLVGRISRRRLPSRRDRR
ncbi:MAG: response regulator [Planctomycetes bacterium]|nr:response regulator [Planctomycetota bacterium]